MYESHHPTSALGLLDLVSSICTLTILMLYFESGADAAFTRIIYGRIRNKMLQIAMYTD